MGPYGAFYLHLWDDNGCSLQFSFFSLDISDTVTQKEKKKRKNSFVLLSVNPRLFIKIQLFKCFILAAC